MTPPTESLGQGIHRVTVSLPFASPRAINCYVIEGEHGVTVIDCGVDEPERLAELNTALESTLGESFTLDRFIGTHMHPDHMGGAQSFMAPHEAEFVMHDSTAGLIGGYNDWNVHRAEVAELARAHGAPPEDQAILDALSPRPRWAGTAIEPTHPVSDGDRIRVGKGRTLEVIHTPGHHPTHICLQDSRTGRLFSGDHILPRITPFIPHDPEGDSLAEYLEGLERLERIDPGITLPAHGETVEQGRARARQIALHHERRLGAMTQVTVPNGATAWQVMTDVFRPDLYPDQKYLAFQETLAHLEHLVNRGKLNRTLDTGTWIYAR